jgi:hypothetical protein
MNGVRMRHPEVAEVVEVPASAVPHHRAAGWVIDESQGEMPPCPTCGQPWPTKAPPQEGQQDQVPAESGASSSESPRRRRKSEESA